MISMSKALAGALLLLCAHAGFSQNITGSVTGSVVDSSGASVAGAAVKLTNTGTGITQSAVSDSAGDFRFLLLPPGNYALDASNPGFKSFRRDGILVEADRSLAVP